MIYNTLNEAIDAVRSADCSVTYIDSGTAEREVSFQTIYDRARIILGHLQGRGLKRGDELILLLNSNEQFIDAFWACLLGGIAPVPIATGISDEQRNKLFRVFHKLHQPHLYTNNATWERLDVFAKDMGLDSEHTAMRKNTILTEAVGQHTEPGEPATVSPDDIAFIQFSSGSTNEPKGVVLTHRNIMANITDIMASAHFTDKDVSLSWMPLTHDMGLIGFHLNMLTGRIRHYLMATDVFIRRPLSWLEQTSAKRATVLCSPNFGYRHLLRALAKRVPEGLDLSSVRLIFNGAEPISAALCEEFLNKLADFGLARNAMYPVYGLAEAALAVSFPEPGAPLHDLSVARDALAQGDHVRTGNGGTQSLRCVSVGRPIAQCQVRIADSAGNASADSTVGRVLIKGPNVTQEYYSDAALNRALISDDGWVDTGDLGFVSDGELYITGRTKDVIFVHGQNVYAHDLEALAVQAPTLELGKVVVGTHRNPDSGVDELLVFVLHRGELEAFLPTAKAITHLISEHAGVEVHRVVPVSRIPKTTSGKLQRYVLEEAFDEGEYDDILQALDSLRTEAADDDTTQSNVEAVLQQICDQVLGEKHVSRNDNLFEIGTNSLKLIEIHTLIEEKFPGRLEVTDMFDYPSLAELAAFLEQKQLSTV